MGFGVGDAAGTLGYNDVPSPSSPPLEKRIICIRRIVFSRPPLQTVDYIPPYSILFTILGDFEPLLTRTQLVKPASQWLAVL